MSNLDAFVTHALPLPEPLATSAEIEDRQSTFVAYIFRASTAQQARAAHTHVRKVLHAKRPASHEIMAWRCMVLKEGRTGLGGDGDFKIEEGSEDDNEQWAGGHVLKVMRSEAAMDAVVVVSRWYGGIMLGPVRFTHIQDCTREVCQAFRVEDEMQDCISTLTSLDDILASLQPGPSQPGRSGKRDKKDYKALQESLDVAKAKRLISAREKAINSVKALIGEANAKRG
ncbi:ribosomal protein S5 domain 2-like protein [Gloeopeniophorella convolvens]|nr:ribosomal protein S5 domain 2-like protein [Gloeopeniophorella convolvens]